MNMTSGESRHGPSTGAGERLPWSKTHRKKSTRVLQPGAMFFTWHAYMTHIYAHTDTYMCECVHSFSEEKRTCVPQLSLRTNLLIFYFNCITMHMYLWVCLCVCVVRGLVHIRQVFHQCLSPVTQPPLTKVFKAGSCLKGSSLTLNLWTSCLNLLGSLNYRSVPTALVMIYYNYCYKMYWYLWTVVITILGWICHSSVDAIYQQPLNIYNLIFWMASYNTIWGKFFTI